MNRRTWITWVGAAVFVTRLRDDGERGASRRPPSVDAFRLEVEATLFHTVSSGWLPDLHARPSHGLARSMDFSNESVWNELVTEAFATAARTTPFFPDAADRIGSPPDEPGIPVVTAVLRHLAEHPDHQLVVRCRSETISHARAVVALLEGDREGFVRATATYQTATGDAAILAFASRIRGWPCAPADRAHPTAGELEAFQSSYNATFDQDIVIDGRAGAQTRAAYFDLFEADATERAGDTGALAWLRTKLDVCDEDLPSSRAEQEVLRPELVELIFIEPELVG